MVYFRYFLALFEVIINNRDTILINTFVSSQAGIQTKPADLKIKTSNLVQVNVLKDQVCSIFSFSGSFPDMLKN